LELPHRAELRRFSLDSSVLRPSANGLLFFQLLPDPNEQIDKAHGLDVMNQKLVPEIESLLPKGF
jgi:hypothetical protein